MSINPANAIMPGTPLPVDGLFTSNVGIVTGFPALAAMLNNREGESFMHVYLDVLVSRTTDRPNDR
jgi:hypothetical protein